MAMPYDSSLSRTATKLLKDSQDNGAIAATRVYGQPDFTSHRCGTFGADFKGRCNGASFSLAVSQGNLYVADTGNSRVLYYPAGSTTATRVYGQPDFTARGLHPGCNTGGVSATSLCEPRDLVVDSQGNLYVEDDGNGRVLYYPAGSTTATRVYGQPNFTSQGCNAGAGDAASATSLCNQFGLAVDGQGNLYVADTGNSRVLYYPASVSPPGHPPVSPPGHPPVSCSAHPRGHPPVKDVTLTLPESSIFANAHLDLVLTGTPCTGVATTAFVTATHLVEFPIGHRRTTPSTTVLVRGAQRGVTDGAGHLYERVVVPSHDTYPIQATVIVLVRIGHRVVVRHASVTVNPTP